MSKLLIVESPTKARTIGRMLGKDYSIIASMGHIRDLPERELGVDVNNHFAPQYVDTPRSKAVVKELRSAAKKADEIYLAPDPDREGEAIAWHLAEVLKDTTKAPFHRVTFHEITRSAIERAMEDKGEININLVDAQQARRVLDRIVGYQVSPLLWSRIEKGSSAGRVQSAALRLVVERERAINAFTPEEYWVFELVFRTENGEVFSTRLFKINGKDFKIGSGVDAQKLLEAVREGSAPEVTSVSGAERRRNAPAPFTTSTLQQTANVSLHYSATNTMRYAQALYEGVDIGEGGAVGLITYMRTDSVTIAREAQEAAATFIRANYGAEYAPAKFNYFKNKAAAQEAHEAIRPTDVNRTPEAMAPFLDAQQLKLYSLIWRRFVASQMTAAIQKLTTVDVGISGSDNNQYTFRATATVPVFAGFSKVYEDIAKKKDETREAAVLGALNEAETLSIADTASEQKFTEPPPRYSEAALIKELEENGIGRPSTYATILRTIQDRKYVDREQGKLIPTELGFSVNDFLVERLPALFDIGFTAKMEKQLDEIEEGSVSWTKMMEEFYTQFAPWLAEAKTFDAPPRETAETLLKLFDNVTYEEPHKVGRRTYDDGKFVRSIREKFDTEGGSVTAKQYQALLTLAAKYKLQGSGSLAGEIEAVAGEQAAREAKRAESEAAASAIDYPGLFAAFANVTFEPPSKKGRFTYDDKKFFNSLKNQALGKRALSEKQTDALRKMAQKYRGELTNLELVDSLLAAPKFAEGEGEAAGSSGVAATTPPEAIQILDALKEVKEWAEPVKKGRFTYDDKQFVESLTRQHSEGKVLSPRQLAALQKMAVKYGVVKHE